MPETERDKKGSESNRLTRPPRQLSRFMCEEMLFDYVEKALDPDRSLAVEQSLRANPDLQKDLELIRSGEKYCDRLSETKIAILELEKLKSIQPWFYRARQNLSYRNWPDLLQWSAQAFVLSSLVALIAFVTPWNKFHPHFMTARLHSHQSVVSKVVPEPNTEAKSPILAVNSTQPPAQVKTQVAKTAIVPTPAPKPAKNISAAEKAPVAPPKLRGVLYRMYMALPDVESVTPAIRQKIISFGGYKAGQVELGWHKVNPSGSYYHFIMPKKNYDELIQTLEGYGPVRISKTAHERVMPPGKIRIILWIKEQVPNSQTTDAGKADTNQ